jgi:hypothetical protein
MGRNTQLCARGLALAEIVAAPCPRRAAADGQLGVGLLDAAFSGSYRQDSLALMLFVSQSHIPTALRESGAVAKSHSPTCGGRHRGYSGHRFEAAGLLDVALGLTLASAWLARPMIGQRAGNNDIRPRPITSRGNLGDDEELTIELFQRATGSRWQEPNRNRRIANREDGLTDFRSSGAAPRRRLASAPPSRRSRSSRVWERLQDVVATGPGD